MGVVESWHEVVSVSPSIVTFRTTVVFQHDGTTLTSDSTLRFRSRGEIAASLEALGFGVHDVRDAPDRSGQEYVFLAVRP